MVDEKSKVVTLCGSSRFCEVMAVCAWLIERDEEAIAMSLHLLPNWYCKEDIPHHLAEHEGVADAMDALHLKKIDLSDEIFVVNRNGYVGKSTMNEVEYARSKKMRIRWYTSDLVGKECENLIKESLEHDKAFKVIQVHQDKIDLLLARINKVTSNHIHGTPITKDSLNALANGQIEFEGHLEQKTS